MHKHFELKEQDFFEELDVCTVLHSVNWKLEQDLEAGTYWEAHSSKPEKRSDLSVLSKEELIRLATIQQDARLRKWVRG